MKKIKILRWNLKMSIVGIVGKKFSGKDTCADFLVDNMNYKKFSFAKGLKQVCQVAFLLSDEQLYDPSHKEIVDERWGKTPRELMQFVGTDLFRTYFDRNIWLKRLEIDIESFPEIQNIVIPDVRFENEYRFLQEYAQKKGIPCFMIHIERDCKKHDTHSSENFEWLENYTNSFHEIENNSSFTELYQKIQNILKY